MKILCRLGLHKDKWFGGVDIACKAQNNRFVLVRAVYCVCCKRIRLEDTYNE